MFSNQKSKFGSIFEVLEMEDVGRFYGHLVHLAPIWYILPVLVFWTKKNLATLRWCSQVHTLKACLPTAGSTK
jgi:hypothetical protein